MHVLLLLLLWLFCFGFCFYVDALGFLVFGHLWLLLCLDILWHFDCCSWFWSWFGHPYCCCLFLNSFKNTFSFFFSIFPLVLLKFSCGHLLCPFSWSYFLVLLMQGPVFARGYSIWGFHYLVIASCCLMMLRTREGVRASGTFLVSAVQWQCVTVKRRIWIDVSTISSREQLIGIILPKPHNKRHHKGIACDIIVKRKTPERTCHCSGIVVLVLVRSSNSKSGSESRSAEDDLRKPATPDPGIYRCRRGKKSQKRKHRTNRIEKGWYLLRPTNRTKRRARTVFAAKTIDRTK